MVLPVKFIFILTIMVNCILKTASTNKRSKEKNSLEATLRQLYRTESESQSESHIDNIASMSVEELKGNIDGVYMDIQCSYIFSAQTYMRLIGVLLVKKEQLANVPRDKDLSFTKEAARMTATLYNVEAMRNEFAKNVMWIVSLFAERVLTYMQSVIERGQAEDQTAILTVHNSVRLFLERYMFSKECLGFSMNNRYDVERDFDDLQGLLAALESKKSLIAHRLDTNAEQNISTAGYERFGLNVLLGLHGLLADIEATELILNSSGADVNWNEVLPHLKIEYDPVTQASGIALSQHILSLAKCNDKFMLMFKVIIIRLMLKYVMYVNSNNSKWDALVNRKSKELQEHKTEFLRVIEELENFLHIQDDKDVDYVKGLVRRHYNLPIKSNDTVANIKYVLTIISMDLYDANSIWRDIKDISMNLEDLDLFVVTVKSALSNIDFIIMKQFKALTGTNEFYNLADIENVIRQPEL